jgi:hypothetical protein
MSKTAGGFEQPPGNPALAGEPAMRGPELNRRRPHAARRNWARPGNAAGRTPGPKARLGTVLAADAELLDQRLIARLVLALDVVEQLAALGNQLEQAAAGMVVLDVALEMLGEVGDRARSELGVPELGLATR